jgi:putative transposase
VEQNPVRAGLASRPEEFRWSSAAAHVSGHDPAAVLDLAFWTEAGGAERWKGLQASPEELIQLRLLRRCTYAGRPFGEDSFVTSLEEQFQRSWRRWSFETCVDRIDEHVHVIDTQRAASTEGDGALC